MKTQKQLPKLFYIQENEKTNEYCERLGLIKEETKESDYGDYVVFEGKEFVSTGYNYELVTIKKNFPEAVFVDLSDYLPIEKKELPNEFVFVCDEHSREQLKKLDVELNGFSIRKINCEYLVRNKNVVSYIDGRFNQKGLILIFLSDYID